MGKDNELLLDYARFAYRKNLAINGVDTPSKFISVLKPRLQSAIADRNLIFGLRAEHMFEAMIRSIAKFQLFKHEDNGIVFGERKFRAPDFRIVLEDGQQWLIEVKNVHSKNPETPTTTLSPKYIDSLRRYADTVGVPLKLAHYWSKINMWTVVNVEQFLNKNGGVKINFLEAMKFSQLKYLGDTMISLPGPLHFRGLGVHSENAPNDSYNWTVWHNQVELTDPRDIKLANILARFGSWPLDITEDKFVGDGVHKIEFRAACPEKSTKGFDSIGFSSMIYCSFYQEYTVDDKEVSGLLAQPQLDWFEPLRDWDFKSSKLQLRLFKIQPQ